MRLRYWAPPGQLRSVRGRARPWRAVWDGGGRAVRAERAVIGPAKVSYERAVVGDPAVAFYELAAVGLAKELPGPSCFTSGRAS